MRLLNSCILWQAVLCNLVLTAPWTSWLPIRTSSRLTRTACMLGSCSPAYLLEGMSCRRLGNCNLLHQVDTSATWTGVSNGIMTGPHRLTREESYRRQDSPDSLHVNVLFTNGSDYIIQHGYSIFGLPPSRMQHMLNWRLWTNNICGTPCGNSTHIIPMAGDVMNLLPPGRPPGNYKFLQARTCIGKTGRRWRPKPTSGRRRRKLRNPVGKRKAPLVRIGPWLLAMLTETFLCPMPQHVFATVFSEVLLCLRTQVLFILWIGFAAQAQRGSRICCGPVSMSDSSVEETPTGRSSDSHAGTGTTGAGPPGLKCCGTRARLPGHGPDVFTMGHPVPEEHCGEHPGDEAA